MHTILRLQLRASNPSLDRIWIGFAWNVDSQEYLYADDTEYQNGTDWLPTDFYNQLMPRYPIADSSTVLNCVSSSSKDGYSWKFTNCADPSFTAMCYVTPSNIHYMRQYS